MPRVSRIPLGEEEIERLFSLLATEITSLKSNSDSKLFIDGLLTQEEKIMLAKRMMVCMMIVKGYHTDAIKEALHVSYETVRTYRNQFPYKNPYFKQQVLKLSKQDEMKSLWERIEQILIPLQLALESHNNMKSRAKLMRGDF